MDPLKVVDGVVLPLDRVNVDTDQIVPKQFLKRVERTGYGPVLFYDWRYLDEGVTPNPDFELNRPQYNGAQILVSGRNFGCGSSREHAPWALAEYGFRVIIAPSFADIFNNNCLQNAILTITLPDDQVAELMRRAQQMAPYRLTVDLENQEIHDKIGFQLRFEIDPFRKFRLLNGLDDIGLTLQHEPAITAYESHRPEWVTLSA